MPVLIKTKVYILVRDIVNTRLNHFNKNKKDKQKLRLRYCQRWDCLYIYIYVLYIACIIVYKRILSNFSLALTP